MDQSIKRKHVTFKVKDIDRITYYIFVHFNKLAETNTTNQIEYLSLFVDISKDELKQKPITEIMHGFFAQSQIQQIHDMFRDFLNDEADNLGDETQESIEGLTQ